MRQTRSAMLGSLSADYVRTARSKGLPERSVVGVHALRNSLTTVVTVLGLQLGALISGAVITEQIFVIPGFGKLTVDAVATRNYPVIQAVVLVTVAGYIVVNLLVDITYALLNPRIRLWGRPMTEQLEAGRHPRPATRRRRPARRWRRNWRRFRRRPLAMAGARAGPAGSCSWRSPGRCSPDPTARTTPRSSRRPRARTRWAPTTSDGTCWPGSPYGARVSLEAGVLSTALAMAVGIPIGLVAGYYRGWLDPI